jgi:hypothetical protein
MHFPSRYWKGYSAFVSGDSLRVYSHVPTFYWPDTEYIPVFRLSIGRSAFYLRQWRLTKSIFPCSVFLLVRHGVYSRVPSFYWSVCFYLRQWGLTKSIFPCSVFLLVRHGVYSRVLSFYWSVCFCLRQWRLTKSIFPCPVFLLVRLGVYSRVLSFYWSDTEYIPVFRPSSGQPRSIFLCSVFLLVRHGLYSRVLSFYWLGYGVFVSGGSLRVQFHIMFFYWSDLEYIPVFCLSIGRSAFAFASGGSLRVYSHVLSFYWPDTDYIPVFRPSSGQPRSIFPCSVPLLARC